MKKLESLQYARAIAAMLVVIDHTVTQFSLYHSTGMPFVDTLLKKTINMGNIGVYVFFAISGYIMSYTTKNKIFDLQYGLIFLRKRIVRIYPLYWIYLTVFISLWAVGLAMRTYNFDIGQIIASYLLVPYGITNGKITPPILAQGWTLIYEMFFYLAFSILIMMKLNKKAIPLLLFLIFFSLMLASRNGLFPLDEINIFFSKWLLLLFVAGIIIERNQEIITQVIGSVNNTILWSLTFILILVATYISKPIIVDYLLSLMILALILPINQNRRNLLQIGDASYTIYLSHIFFVMTYGMLVKNITNITLGITMGIATAFTSIIAGVILYNIIEKKIHH
ncbi:acyltransferase family protein [Serratia grimesii]|uniref:acyltransferase family protein n=1 Tax=Serratia grimesii TaxID=82995 RepID=UPI00077C0EB5|nr:acyltransferase [Serratia grimesii]CAI1054249.1 Acyltransferase family [Serratia grimesii]CAI2500645.1 Acyltransferase family [Serratia grimesii]SUI36811.1 Acyltransferase family [Serratia grimesii]